MSYVHVPTELWTTSLMPEGILERWSEDGPAGEPDAEARQGVFLLVELVDERSPERVAHDIDTFLRRSLAGASCLL